MASGGPGSAAGRPRDLDMSPPTSPTAHPMSTQRSESTSAGNEASLHNSRPVDESLIPSDLPGNRDRRPSSPSEAAAHARNPQDLLRRLSLAAHPPETSREAQFGPNSPLGSLGLTGNVISAAFCLPYKIEYAPGAEWVGAPRTILLCQPAVLTLAIGSYTASWHLGSL